MLSGYASATRALASTQPAQAQAYTKRAVQAAEFIRKHSVTEDGALLRCVYATERGDKGVHQMLVTVLVVVKKNYSDHRQDVDVTCLFQPKCFNVDIKKILNIIEAVTFSFAFDSNKLKHTKTFVKQNVSICTYEMSAMDTAIRSGTVFFK